MVGTRALPVREGQASGWTDGFFAKRLRATSAAAAAPNRKTMGGAGTGSGPPLDPPLDPPVLLVLVQP